MDELATRYARNLEAYFDMLEENGQKEAIAHLANLFESGNYQKAILFITRHAPSVYTKMAEFIANL